MNEFCRIKKIGERKYELANHLGNVLTVITDKKLPHSTSGTTVDYYTADVISATDYYPFGSPMPGRTFDASASRYGFNGKEKTDEISGEGNSYDFGARMYDSRLGRWLSVDPLAAKYPDKSSYSFVGGMPIIAIDPNGKEIWLVYQYKDDSGNPKLSQVRYEDGKFFDTEGNEWDQSQTAFGKNYIKAVAEDLNKLKNDSPKAKRVIDALEKSSSENIYISNHENMFRENPLEDSNLDEQGVVPVSRKLDRKDGAGNGTWITYNPYRSIEMHQMDEWLHV